MLLITEGIYNLKLLRRAAWMLGSSGLPMGDLRMHAVLAILLAVCSTWLFNQPAAAARPARFHEPVLSGETRLSLG
jgi:hypothetical protein